MRSGATQGGQGAYGTVPTVPQLDSTQLAAILGNTGNLGKLFGLTNSLNVNAAEQAQVPLNLNLPNYQQNLQQRSQNITAAQQGVLPQDFKNQLGISAAERGVGTGGIYGANNDAALLRALGTNSLARMDTGQQQFNQSMATTPTGTQFNPISFLNTPGMFQSAQYGANVLGAAPNPRMAADEELRRAQQGLGTSWWHGSPNSGMLGGNQTSSGWAGAQGSTGLGAMPSSLSPMPRATGQQFGPPGASANNPMPRSTGEQFGPNPWGGTGTPLPGYSGSQWTGSLMDDLGANQFTGQSNDINPWARATGEQFGPNPFQSGDQNFGYQGPGWTGDMLEDMNYNG